MSFASGTELSSAMQHLLSPSVVLALDIDSIDRHKV